MEQNNQEKQPSRRGRPRTGVTEQNGAGIWCYFNRALRNRRANQVLRDGALQIQALDELYQVGDEPEQMQAWVDTYVSPDGWRLALAAKRQSRHAYQTQSVTVAHLTHDRLKDYAKCHGLTLSRALDKLIDIAVRPDVHDMIERDTLNAEIEVLPLKQAANGGRRARL